eukprot:m51a1_g10945 hypothetical protein (509) ;mRNA; f:190940-192703
MSVVSALCWVGRGKFKAIPVEDPEAQDADEDEDEDVVAPAAPQASAKDDAMIDPELAEYGLDKYDEEDDGEDRMMTAIVYKDSAEDPNLVEPEDDSDVEEETIMQSDMFVLAATTEVSDDYSHLDVHLYEEGDRNMFCHHDTMLPAFPLCLAWMDAVPGGNPSDVGNFCAVGTCEKAIEIWDLDVKDPLEAAATLGGFDESKSRLKRKKTHAVKPDSHRDAVMSLSWNKIKRNILASGSADNTVKTWDVNTLQNIHTYGHHTGKVQVVAWHPSEPSVMLTCSYDRRACVVDSRTDVLSLQWRLDADPESADWVSYSPARFLLSTEDGNVRLFDAQAAAAPAEGAASKGSAPVWTLSAHSKAVSCIAQSPVPGFIVTGSVDRHVKLWNITGNPVCLYGQDTSTAIYSAAFSPESPFLLAIGSGAGVRVWDTLELASVHKAFAPANAKPPSGKLTEILPPGAGEEDEEEAEMMAGGSRGAAAAAAAPRLPKVKKSKKKPVLKMTTKKHPK